MVLVGGGVIIAHVDTQIEALGSGRHVGVSCLNTAEQYRVDAVLVGIYDVRRCYAEGNP
jgi:hypothetical protein